MQNNELPKALIISVGGRTKPIASSINMHNPKLVYFIASEESAKTIDQKTSYGEPIVKSVDFQFDYKIFVVVDVDSLNSCFEEARKAYEDLKRNFKGKIIVDYTGGTKTMSVALAFLATFKNLTFVL